jgi:NADH:ubiquinone oxidoreductase subunit 6 (subunit J)
VTLREDATFWLFIGTTILPALFAVRSRDAMKGVIWLSISLIGVAALFLLLGSTILLLFQLIIYVGAVTVLYVWGVMLMRTEIQERVE